MRAGKLVLACAIALVTVLSVSTPASAITYGTPDTTHAYVGAWVVLNPDGTIFGWCSGSLVGPRVFLTAGHCGELAALFPLSQMFVTFAADPLDRKQWRPVASFAVEPGYVANMADPHDVAVVILAKPVHGIAPGNLAPSAGYLDELAATRMLIPHTTTFEVVGYGWDQNLQPTNLRESVMEGFLALEPAWLSNSENVDLGFGGGCLGDSGGPVLFTSGTVQYIVSLVSSGDTFCRSLDKSYRVDTAESLSFIQAAIEAYA